MSYSKKLDLNVTKNDVLCPAELENFIFDAGMWGDWDEDENVVACSWGKAYYGVNYSLPYGAPSKEWEYQSPWHTAACYIFGFSDISEEQMYAVLNGIRDDGSIVVRDVDFTETRFFDINLANITFVDCNFTGARMLYNRYENVKFENCNMTDTDFVFSYSYDDNALAGMKIEFVNCINLPDFNKHIAE